MNDSLKQTVDALAGIPNWGTRLTIAVTIVFALVIVIVLLYFRIVELDERLEGSDSE